MVSKITHDRRTFERKDLEIFVHFNFHGHEKVFESKTHNISMTGLFVKAKEDILKLINIGNSIFIMLEFKKNFFIKLNAYVVRIENNVPEFGFGVKFLELNQDQINTLSKLISSF